MPSFTPAQVGHYFPKQRDLVTKIVPITRTDSSTAKCSLPKGAVVVGLHVFQAAAAVTGAATFNLGWTGQLTGLVNAFSMGTTSVGLQNPGAQAGSQLFTKLDSDKKVIATFTPATSTDGGTGYVMIEYFVAGGNEAVDD